MFLTDVILFTPLRDDSDTYLRESVSCRIKAWYVPARARAETGQAR